MGEIADNIWFRLAAKELKLLPQLLTYNVSGEVCYSRNNFKMTTLMHVDRTLPLWAFFDVYGNVQKIKMLGKLSGPIVAFHEIKRSRCKLSIT